MSDGHGSEVARLLEQIRVEYEAAMRAVRGTALGTARHSFITTRMENMGKLDQELQAYVGEESMAMIVTIMNETEVAANQSNP